MSAPFLLLVGIQVITPATKNTTYYGNDHSLASENEKLKLIIQHKEELLTQKNNEIAALKKLVAALETNPQNP